MSELRDIEKTIRESGGAFAQLVRSIQDAAEQARLVFQEVRNPLAQVTTQFAGYFQRVNRDQRVAVAGWYPHPCLSLDSLDIDQDTSLEDIDHRLAAYVGENWGSLRAALEESSSQLKLEGDHHETLMQCLQAHELALYRCVPRTLFAEIEMASRITLNGLPLNNKVNAGLKPVFATIGDLPISVLPPDVRTLVSYSVLTEHVYRDSRYNPSGYTLPNRHDQMHGYSGVHPTSRDNVNMLLLTDTMFRILSVLSELKREYLAKSERIDEAR